MFKMEFDTNNDAFQKSDIEEITRILKEVKSIIEQGFSSGIIRDINGNKIGWWRF